MDKDSLRAQMVSI